MIRWARNTSRGMIFYHIYRSLDFFISIRRLLGSFWIFIPSSWTGDKGEAFAFSSLLLTSFLNPFFSLTLFTYINFKSHGKSRAKRLRERTTPTAGSTTAAAQASMGAFPTMTDDGMCAKQRKGEGDGDGWGKGKGVVVGSLRRQASNDVHQARHHLHSRNPPIRQSNRNRNTNLREINQDFYLREGSCVSPPPSPHHHPPGPGSCRHLMPNRPFPTSRPTALGLERREQKRKQKKERKRSIGRDSFMFCTFFSLLYVLALHVSETSPSASHRFLLSISHNPHETKDSTKNTITNNRTAKQKRKKRIRKKTGRPRSYFFFLFFSFLSFFACFCLKEKKTLPPTKCLRVYVCVCVYVYVGYYLVDRIDLFLTLTARE
ncbi:hypothetical protein F4778DRAFT_137072 [Xylariomycetidae sp. FL2044]|nr:hypothetical protein F4778DRAFT_137072 [Xylariomycetidae sp. FL2044]